MMISDKHGGHPEAALDRQARIAVVVARLNECLTDLDALDCGHAAIDVDRAITRLGGQPVPLLPGRLPFDRV